MRVRGCRGAGPECPPGSVTGCHRCVSPIGRQVSCLAAKGSVFMPQGDQFLMSLDTIDPDGSGIATWSLPRTPAVGNRHDPAPGE